MEDNVITKQDLLEIKADIVEEIMAIFKYNLKDRYLAKKVTCNYLEIANNH